MDNKVYTFEGKTSTEAIEKGLKELNVSKSKVDIKVLESEDKRSFFSILTPRVVKVEIRLKEDSEIEKSKNEEQKVNNTKNVVKDNKTVSDMPIDLKEYIKIVDNFLSDFISKLPENDLKYEIKEDGNTICVNINGSDTGFLIGYRGEVLNSIQTILTNIISKSNREKIRVLVDIGGYREKREKDLQNLAGKIASTVIRTKRDITLEPMPAYERKIIHTKLQENNKVKTYSIGEEPYRKIVVAYKK